jgi:hypothetical protein
MDPHAAILKEPVHSLAALSQKERVSTSYPSQSSRVPEWVIVMLLLSVQPLAWYFIWKDKKYHGWFATILFFNSILSIIIPIILLFTVIPQLSQLYVSLRITNPSTFIPQAGAVCMILLAFWQLWFSLQLRKRIKAKGELPKDDLTKTILILILSTLLFSLGSTLLQLSVIIPLYGALGMVR